LPVIMLERPPLPDVDRMFETIDALLAALETWRVGNDVLAIRPSSGS
jgi:precorrin-6A/cobalt-precorrin-6A reductase